MESEKKRQLLKLITLQHIEIFLTVARYSNISQASKELYISQPAISSRLKQMEDAVGTSLFLRTNRGIELTHEGEILQAKLELVYHRFRITINNLVKEARHITALYLGSLHIPDIIEIMNKAAGIYHSSDSGQNIETEYFQSNELLDKLLCRELNMVFTLLFCVETMEDIEYRVLGSTTLSLVYPRGWAGSSSSSLQFLSDRTLLLGLDSGKDRVTDICRQKGFTPADIYYQSSDFLLSQMVADGAGYTVTANIFAFNEKHKPYINIVPLTDFKEPIVAAWRRQEKGEWLSRFLNLLDSM